MKINESIDSIKSIVNNEKYIPIFGNKNDSSNNSYNSSFLENNKNDNFKYNNSWDFYFSQNLQFDFTIHGLNQLKLEIFHFYINMFCFDENEIEIKKKYILGLSSLNELNEITKYCSKNKCMKLFCQIFKKNELEKISNKNDFFKVFKHYFIWCLNKSFELGKIKNKYTKTKFSFESIESVIDNLYEEGKIFNKEINLKPNIALSEDNLKEKPKEMKIDILNDDKIPELFYELNELNNDEKNFCVIKSIKDESSSYYQGSIYYKDINSSDTFSSNFIKKPNENKSNENKSYDSKINDNKNIENKSLENNSNENKSSENKKNKTNSNKIDKNDSIKDNNKKHGLGREYHLKIKNNDDIRYKYLGYYKNNKFHGYGILIKENDELYYGEFRDGLKNGFGYLYTKYYNYKGFFYKDKKEGYGEYFNKGEGVSYCGNFVNDKFNGYGFYYKDNVFKYIGNFIEGYLKGLGLYIWNSNEQYYGFWSENKMNGNGIYIYKEGDIFIGSYLNDKKNGKGQYIYSNNKSTLEGQWKNGIKKGEFKFTCYKNGNKISVDLKYVNNREMNYFTFDNLYVI